MNSEAQSPPSQQTDACVFTPTWMQIFFIAFLQVVMVRKRHVCCLADAQLLQQRSAQITGVLNQDFWIIMAKKEFLSTKCLMSVCVFVNGKKQYLN